ncbi:MAG: 4-(cytidine 5'-diphospho)-2-C-methyl-D-erythritol kinase [Bacteroidales bacterium]|nr:4-(cytidine 5'-diphospho)-2-C-methyl-D-erythritol kinase [Bacteroidales bacterium]
MIVFPNAKINLGLNVVARRKDGYHNIETLFYPVNLRDILEVLPSQDSSRPRGTCTLHTTGMDAECAPEDNLVVKAYNLLNSHYSLPPVDFYLWKIIPSQAGLGGGSSDAAFALKALNEMAGLHLSENELEKLAAQLGADCPFFIRNRPILASGIGNEFQETDLSLKDYHLYIVKPPVNVSTKNAYKGINPKNPEYPIHEIIKKPVEQWKDKMINDFEKSVFETIPTLRDIKLALYDNGALYCSMTGSGSAFFGIFPKDCKIDDLFDDSFVWQGAMI